MTVPIGIREIPCWRRCGRSVNLLIHEDECVSLLNEGDALFRNARVPEGGGNVVAVCAECLSEFAPAEEIAGASFEPCFECKQNWVLVLQSRDGTTGFIGGRAIEDNIGQCLVLADIICSECLIRLGFWRRLLRQARIEFALAMG